MTQGPPFSTLIPSQNIFSLSSLPSPQQIQIYLAAASVAGVAGCPFAFLGASAFAGGAQNFPLHSQLHGFALVEILQGNVEFVHDAFGGATPRTTTATAHAKEHFENVACIAHAAAARHAALLDGLLAAAIIKRSLLLIGKNAIGKGNVFELHGEKQKKTIKKKKEGEPRREIYASKHENSIQYPAPRPRADIQGTIGQTTILGLKGRGPM